jgi:hypothetical protein
MKTNVPNIRDMKLGENLGLDRFYLDKGTRKTVLPAREARGLDEGPSRAGPQVRNHGVIFGING